MTSHLYRILVAGLFTSLVILTLGCSTGKSTDVDEDDIMPAAPITDLRVVGSTRATITLAWTVPSSDATHGTAAWYDLRKSTSPLSAATWDSATQIMEVPPAKPGGETEIVQVAGLSAGTRYYFGLKCCTDSGGWSDLSNLIDAPTIADVTVVFLDANLETAIRQKLSKPEGAILGSEMEAIIDLQAAGRGIVDLTGMEHCSRIQFLALNDNSIADLGPLSELEQLFDLGLNNNRISDVAPLSGLPGLRHLHLALNQIADLSPLAGLPDLEILTVSNNPVTSGLTPIATLTKMTNLDISRTGIASIAPVALMTKLQTIDASFNGISDITALENLPELSQVWLLQNQITDLAPLVANAGLTFGDGIDLQYNPLSEAALSTQIPVLQARGVTVTY